MSRMERAQRWLRPATGYASHPNLDSNPTAGTPQRVGDGAMMPPSDPNVAFQVPGVGGQVARVGSQIVIGPHKPIRRTLKRIIDIVVSLIVLLLCAPFFFMIAVLLRLTAPGPVIFAHPRVGRHGQIFPCYKFRTMVVDSDHILAEHLKQDAAAARQWEECQKLDHDPRVTAVGHLLRKSSLDELPQFYNILLGHMSCVGPRPVSLPELQRYGSCIAEYLSVRPGLTGIWQISGRSRISYGTRVMLDADYVRRWSLRRDLLILIKTVPAVLKLNEAA